MNMRSFGICMLLFSSAAFSCGVHQQTGFHMVTEDGSLDVFEQVIAARQINALGNLEKPDHFRLFSFKKELNRQSQHQISFTLFEAVKGHYSDVDVDSKISIKGSATLPNEGELVLVTELDVLDALAHKVITWQQATEQGLVQMNGPVEKVLILDMWFSELF